MFNRLSKLAILSLLLSGCTTLDGSLKLGATIGSIGGAAAMYAAAESSGHSPQASQLYGASAIGLGLGLLTSYLIHESVPVDRQPTQNLPELYFGDLPPSPFIMSELNFKKKAAK